MSRRVVAVLAVLLGAVIAAVTLLPVPATWTCVSPELDVTTVLPRIVNGGFGDIRELANNGALVQFLENVAMFMPVGGILLALSRRRSISIALFEGLAFSVLIELTQATGDWGLVRCAYRAFDVGDLISNGLGALLGASLVRAAVAISRRHASRSGK